MELDRRHLLAASAGIGFAATTAPAQAGPILDHSVRITPGGKGDDTPQFQRAIDQAAAFGQPLAVGPGVYKIERELRLRANSKLIGPHGLATLYFSRRGAMIAEGVSNIELFGLTLLGTAQAQSRQQDALLKLNTCLDITLTDIVFQDAPKHAIALWQCSGSIERCRFERTGHTAIRSGNAQGLRVANNRIQHAGNNGVVVWRDKTGPDGTSVVHNHISDIRTDAGGTGQNGNAINAFRSGHVLIANNMIANCAYSAVRCNAASNAQVLANNCRNIGEVALYAEFGFEGAVIANNLVDHAATGIEVTNFKEGGRLATVQGNIIRNLVRREHEPVDKRGTGIAVEADTLVSGNTIENAPTTGMSIGFGKWIRNVSATGNLIRNARVGIGISVHGRPQSTLISTNIITNTRDGAVRLFDHNTAIGKPLTQETAAQSPAVLQGNVLS